MMTRGCGYVGPCAECGKRKHIAAHGLCEACYQRERRARLRGADRRTDWAIELERYFDSPAYAHAARVAELVGGA